MKSNGKPKELLTVREQQFYAFWRKLGRKKPSQSEIARMLNVPRQRVFQLISNLKEKNWIEVSK